MSENNLFCVFCKKEFKTKQNVKTHQKTAKYCLEIQKKLEKNKIKKEKEYFSCEYCGERFTYKHRLYSHYGSCKEKIITEKDKQTESIIMEKDKQIEELKKMVISLQNTISDIAKNPKSITNNNHNHTNNIVVNNSLNLNDIDRIQNVLDEHLDGNVLCNGQKGLAKMIYEKLLIGEDGKSIYKCVDPSRQNFEYVNEEGKVERDVKASKLTNALIKGEVCKKALDVGHDLWRKEDGSTDSTRFEALSDKVFEVANINKDDSKFRSALSALTS